MLATAAGVSPRPAGAAALLSAVVGTRRPSRQRARSLRAAAVAATGALSGGDDWVPSKLVERDAPLVRTASARSCAGPTGAIHASLVRHEVVAPVRQRSRGCVARRRRPGETPLVSTSCPLVSIGSLARGPTDTHSVGPAAFGRWTARVRRAWVRPEGSPAGQVREPGQLAGREGPRGDAGSRPRGELLDHQVEVPEGQERIGRRAPGNTDSSGTDSPGAQILCCGRRAWRRSVLADASDGRDSC